jgi:hypothetical protein
MSLELALQQNTAAINALIEILKTGAVPVAPAAEEQAPEAPKAKRTKKEAAPATAGEPASAPKAEASADGEPAAPEKPAASPASSTTTEAKQVTYTEAAAAVTNVAKKKGRDVAVEILAKFGAKTLGEVKASSYAKVIAECEAVL